jgi:two-component system nitrogen regulation sensor histidine kinase GlnL
LSVLVVRGGLAAVRPPKRQALTWPTLDFGAMLGALPIPLVAIDPSDRFLYANSAAEHFLGLSVGQLTHMTLPDLVEPDCPMFQLVAQVRRGAATASDHDLTLRGPRLDKTGITAQATPLFDERGAILVTFQDSSGARALDRQLAYRGAARSVSGMAAILAHEVKNPLSGIRGAAQLLEGTVPARDRELAVLIREEADRIRELVDRMEQFGDRPLVRQPVNIHRVLDHVRRVALTGFAAHLRIAEVYDPSLPSVHGHRDQLVQVVLNLVKNAAEAITDAGIDGGEIVLATRYEEGPRVSFPGQERPVRLPLVVSVRDNGPGIGDDIRSHLFEPFVTTKRTGTGLGLSLVAKIVGDHGGLIEVDSRPGRTEFRLRLPILTDGATGETG